MSDKTEQPIPTPDGGGFFSDPSVFTQPQQQAMPGAPPVMPHLAGQQFGHQTPGADPGYVQVIDPRTGQPQLIPSSMIEAWHAQQAAARGFEAVMDEDEDEEGSVGPYCPKTFQNCPESEACALWTEAEDEEEGNCIWILGLVSEESANQAKAAFFDKATDVIEDLQSGNPTASPIAAMLGRLSAFLDFSTETMANELAGGFPAGGSETALPVAEAVGPVMDPVTSDLAVS